MDKERWTWWDLLIALLVAAIVVTEMWLAIKIHQVDEDTERVEAIAAEAQERIDNYLSSLPAQERPEETSAPATASDSSTVMVIAPEEEEIPEWYKEDIPLEPELQKALWDACQEFGVEYPLALAVIEQETGYQNLIGDDGDSIGYFQIQPYWWSDMMEQIGVDDLTDPAQNFRAGCAVLRYFLDINDGSVSDALTAYNPGYSGYAGAVMEIAEGWQ